MDEVFLKPNYQKNNNLCLADIQRTLKPKQMWEVLQIPPSQSHTGAFSGPVKELRLGSQHQIRDSALALWQRGTFHEEPQRELSEACQHRAVSSSWVRNVNAHGDNHTAWYWCEPLWLLRFLFTEESLWGCVAVTQPLLRCWGASLLHTGSPEHLWGYLPHLWGYLPQSPCLFKQISRMDLVTTGQMWCLLTRIHSVFS